MTVTLEQIKEVCARFATYATCETCVYDGECVHFAPKQAEDYYPSDWVLSEAPYGYMTAKAIDIHLNSKAHGWWDEERSTAETIALCHSELSEALEEARNGNPLYYEENGKPEGIATEMIDCVIRIFDYLAYEGVDIDDVLAKKMKYNEGRPYKHGKEF